MKNQQLQYPPPQLTFPQGKRRPFYMGVCSWACPSPHHSLLPSNTEVDSHLLFVIGLANPYRQPSSLIYVTCPIYVRSSLLL